MLYSKMSDQQHMSRQSDDEDDLEILRLAALKSLHHKKELVSSCHMPSSQQRNLSVPSAKYPHKRLLPGMNYINDPVKRGYYLEEQILRQPIKPVDNYERIYEKIDINEPYVPQQMCSNSAPMSLIVNNGWNADVTSTTNGYPALYPAPNSKDNIGLPVGNVQLSPRSMAFVAENNDILMRRKGENTSPHYTRSPSPCFRMQDYNPSSPVYHQTSPGRWSMTPPPKSKSRSPPPRNRWNYPHRRSDSRSPILRRRTSSRSPPVKGPPSRYTSPHRYSSWSPKYPNKRLRSRSPSMHTQNRPTHWRMSRSPIRHTRHRDKTKSPVNPIGKKRSSPIPRRSHKSRKSPNNPKRSSSYGQDEARHNHSHKSPRYMAVHTAKSRSRSPNRKISRRSNERNSLFTQPARRNSPSNNNGRRRMDESSTNGYRNRGRKRSTSPISNKTKATRSRTPDKNRRDDSRNKRPERSTRKGEESISLTKVKRNSTGNVSQHFSNGKQAEDENAEKSINTNEMGDVKKIEEKQKSAEAATDKTKLQGNEEDNITKYEELPEENKEENSSDESIDDGIDLFPSDESEYENEGRFKLGMNTNERNENVPVPSFRKLGEPVALDVAKDLKEVGNSSSSQKGNSDKRRSNRDRSERSRYESSRRRGERLKRSETSRSRNDRRRNETSNSSRRDYEESSRHNDKRRSERPMFKSTFQAIDNEANKTSGKRAEENDINGKKNSMPLKKKHRNEDDQESTEKEVVQEKLSSVVNSSSGSNNSTRTSGKKPIHLRLGAMTNTFKAPKKSSLWNSSQDKV